MVLNQATHTRLDAFNKTIQLWIDSVDAYTLPMLQRRPGNGCWSLGQVYSHIIDNTLWFVEQMKATMATRENAEEEMNEEGRRMFRNNDFPDILIQGPDTGLAIPQPESKEELVERLATLQQEVNALFASFDASVHRGKTAHPGLRYFSAGEWLQFAEMHMRHHLRQKQRIDEFLAYDTKR